jgi:Zn-dependent protease with chaperone function
LIEVTRDEYESLIKRLEHEAAVDPSGYRRRLGALALLGYGYLAAAVLLLVCGTVLIGWLSATSAALLLVAKKTGWALAAIAFVASRTLGVRITPPQGHRLVRQQCPQLFAQIDEIRARLRSPRVHRVLLTGEFNAAIVQHPRLSRLGGSCNYLLLGLPLMQCLSAAEFEAVIAHELGHLSGAHGRFGAWIYRARTSWSRLLSLLSDEKLWGGQVLSRFVSWYGPLFNAYSFVQARQQEYEADRMSVEVVGAAPTAAALLRVAREGEFLGQTFWPGVFRRAYVEPAPDVSPFELLGQAMKQPDPPGSRADWLTKALAQRTGHADTHPCLADRLTALGAAPYEPPPVQESAAEALLGPAAETLRREMDADWRARVRSWWVERHQWASDSRETLAQLERKAHTEPLLSEEELWERARLTDELGGETGRAISLYGELLERNSQHVGGLWRLGQLRLALDDERGIELLSTAARLDPTLEEPACAAVVGFHRRHGREAEAREHERRAWRPDPARRERITVHARDRFAEHGLTPATTAELVRRLSALGSIRQAFLVRKHVGQRAMLVRGVQSTAPWWKLLDSGSEKSLIAKIMRECRMLPDMLVVSLQVAGGLKAPMQRVPGSEIFRRS